MEINFHKSIDSFSLGHIIYGLMVNCIFTLVSQFNFSYMIGIYLSPLSIFAFIGWEILEHTLIYKYIYSKVLKNWSETKMNSIMDIVIAESSFYIGFIIFYVLIHNVLISIANLIITTCLIPIVIFILVKINNIKQKIIFDRALLSKESKKKSK
ncbi:MAG: hypothetical protein ACFFBH_14945 [Promethearchaeota archaeon]